MNYIESRTDNNSALFVSLNKPHNRLTESGVELRLREMGKKVGGEKVHPHKFRRTMATRAIEKGMPIEQVQKILGHEQIDTTLRYAMVNQNNVKLSHRKHYGSYNGYEPIKWYISIIFSKKWLEVLLCIC